MKIFQLLFLALFLGMSLFSQSPQSFKYQAVARDGSGNILANKSVTFRISIVSGTLTGTTVYSELHSKTTNGFGLIDLEIGKGSSPVGSLSAINWGSNEYFVKVEMDTDGGTAYQNMGASQLLSVPYALYANDVQNNDDADANPNNEIQHLSLSGSVISLDNGGGSVTLPSSSGDNWGSQVVNTNITLMGQGTTVSPLGVANSAITPNWANIQDKPSGFSDGIDNIDDADNSITNEIQTLSLSGTQLSLSKDGGTVTLPESGGGDNWGVQVVNTNTTLIGQGTSANPLGVANSVITPDWANIQNIPTGFSDAIDHVDDDDNSITNEIQTLSILGNDLTLSKDGGTVALPIDDWGTQAVVTDATLSGNGIIGTPLKIAQHGAIFGDVLKWDGIGWLPGTDNSSLWQKYGSYIYFNTGLVGIGTGTPSETLDIFGNSIASLRVKGGTSDAILLLDKGSTSRYSAIDFLDQGTTKFWAGLLTNNNFRISTIYNVLNGIEITSNGDVNLSDNLYLPVGKKIGMGVVNPINVFEILGEDNCYQRFYSGTSGFSSTDGLLVGLKNSTNYAYVWNFENGPISLGTNNNTRVYIGEDGDVGIGTIYPAAKLDIAGIINLNKDIASGQAIKVNGDEALWYNGTYFSWGFDAAYNYFARPVGIKTTTLSTYELVVNGEAAKTGGGSWSSYSDIRLKDVIGNYDKGLDDIIQLQPILFKYKENNPRDLPSDVEQIGFVAQEVQKVFPEAVNEDADGYLDFNIHSINVAMVNAVKELKAENEKLKTENEKLRVNGEQLNARLEKIEAYLSATSQK